MSVIVKGGGGAAKQEKTVTAGTGVTEVTPDTGKLLSKVVVNPTPSQTKEVTAGTGDTTVSPDSGKLLSGVTVHPTPSHTKTVTAGTSNTTVSPDSGKLLSRVTVQPTPSQSKTVSPSTSKQTVSPDRGKLLSSVSIGAIQTEEKTVTAGTSAKTVTPTSGKYIKKVTVNPTPSQNKTVTPSDSQQIVTPDAGKLLSKVTVNAYEPTIMNGIVKEYLAAADDISPNTFVEFVNINASLAKKSTVTVSGTLKTDHFALPNLFKINDNKVLFVCRNSGNSITYAVVATLSEDGVTVGTPLNINDQSGIVQISSNRFLALESGTSITYTVFDVLDDGTITISLTGTVSTGYNYNYTLAMEKIDDTSVLLVTYSKRKSSGSYNNYLYELTLNEDSVTISESKGELYISSKPSRLVHIGNNLYAALFCNDNESNSYISLKIFEYSNGILTFADNPIQITCRSEYKYTVSALAVLNNVLLIGTTPVKDTYSVYHDIQPVIVNSLTDVTICTALRVDSDYSSTYKGMELSTYNGKDIAFLYTGEVGSKSVPIVGTVECSSDCTLTMSTELLFPTTDFGTYPSDSDILMINESRVLAAIRKDVSSGVDFYSTLTPLSFTARQTKVKGSESAINGLTKSKVTASLKGKVWTI